LFFYQENITGKLNPNGGAVKVGTNYDIEIDKIVVQKKNDIEHPLFVLPQNCAVQNERVQDFGRVIFIKILFEYIRFFFRFNKNFPFYFLF
jgi:hypothetical protein